MRISMIALAAAAALSAGLAQAETATYGVDPTHTFVTFEISHFGAAVNRGRFDKKEGTVQLDKAAKTGKVEITFDGDKVTSVAGNLTLLGKTAPLTLSAKQFNCYQSPMLKREVCGGDFEATIDRTQWGMNYGIDWGFPKNVHLVVQVEAVKQ